VKSRPLAVHQLFSRDSMQYIQCPSIRYSQICPIFVSSERHLIGKIPGVSDLIYLAEITNHRIHGLQMSTTPSSAVLVARTEQHTHFGNHRVKSHDPRKLGTYLSAHSAIVRPSLSWPGERGVIRMIWREEVERSRKSEMVRRI